MAEKVVIKFRKRGLFPNLYLGIAWLLLGMSSIYFDEKTNWVDYGYFVLGGLYISFAASNFIFQYLIIEGQVIHKNILYGLNRKVNLNDVKRITKIAGDYTLITDDGEFKIHTHLIEPNSLEVLETLLSTVDLPPEMTPFHSFSTV